MIEIALANRRASESFYPDVQRGNLPLSYRLLREMGGLLSFAQEVRDRVFTVALPKSPPQEAELEGRPHRCGF